jgi:murein DD-endopeptidase MepM/ murein hydrolase activator NlpD
VRKLIYILSALLLIISNTTASEYDTQNQVSVTTLEHPSETDIVFNNKTYGYVTVTINFTKFENAIADKDLPLTVSIKPLEKLLALKISQKDTAKPWNTYFMYDFRFGLNNVKIDSETPYFLPYEKGLAFKVGQGYDGKYTHKDEMKYSLDFDMPVGTKVLSARSGVVIESIDNFDENGFTEYYRNRNNYISIQHEDGTVGMYVHIKKNGSIVKPGKKISAGDMIAVSGNVGYSAGPHLHFMVQRPISGKIIESLPVKFRVAEILQQLDEGKVYTKLGK